MLLIPAILHQTLELAAAGVSWPVIIGIETAASTATAATALAILKLQERRRAARA